MKHYIKTVDELNSKYTHLKKLEYPNTLQACVLRLTCLAINVFNAVIFPIMFPVGIIYTMATMRLGFKHGFGLSYSIRVTAKRSKNVWWSVRDSLYNKMFTA